MPRFKFSVPCLHPQADIPFHTIFGPLLKRNVKTIKKICNCPLLDVCSIYTGLLGILGMSLSLFDIIRVIKCGKILPQSLWRSRIIAGKVVRAEYERDLKLISLVLSFEYYMFLIVGSIAQNPIFFIPWLLLHALIINLELAVFVCHLFVNGFKFSKHGLCLTIFLIYNWLSVFCTFIYLI